MNAIHVVGIGLEGASGLSNAIQQIVAGATLLVGSDRHLGYFPAHPARRIELGDLRAALAQIREQIGRERIVILVSGDPLFFGFGRLLLAELPAEQLMFHPQVSAIQMAFSRLKVPWQDAQVISAHGRSLDLLVPALQQGVAKIAVLTDRTHTPAAIARLYLSLDLPTPYQFWVCENLGGVAEQVQVLAPEALAESSFAALNVVVLLRTDRPSQEPLHLDTLPQFGLPDGAFVSFSDRPGLMTKREIRVLALAELGLQPHDVVWDIGAGTGSVAIEIARLLPTARIYAIEKTALGIHLIQQNCQRFGADNVTATYGSAPEVLQDLPSPHRVFIGGSSGSLREILNCCCLRLVTNGVIVVALATVEHLSIILDWCQHHAWNHQLLQVQLSRSVPVGSLTRLAPLNPVTLVKITRDQ